MRYTVYRLSMLYRTRCVKLGTDPKKDPQFIGTAIKAPHVGPSAMKPKRLIAQGVSSFASQTQGSKHSYFEAFWAQRPCYIGFWAQRPCYIVFWAQRSCYIGRLGRF